MVFWRGRRENNEEPDRKTRCINLNAKWSTHDVVLLVEGSQTGDGEELEGRLRVAPHHH